VNAALTWLATKPAWALQVAWWALLAGATAFVFIRIGEILRDEDMPLTPVPVRGPTRVTAPERAVPMTLDLGLYGPNLDALEASS
jgi:hypothetical protein